MKYSRDTILTDEDRRANYRDAKRQLTICNTLMALFYAVGLYVGWDRVMMAKTLPSLVLVNFVIIHIRHPSCRERRVPTGRRSKRLPVWIDE